jgi:hypothetical protein
MNSYKLKAEIRDAVAFTVEFLVFFGVFISFGLSCVAFGYGLWWLVNV